MHRLTGRSGSPTSHASKRRSRPARRGAWATVAVTLILFGAIYAVRAVAGNVSDVPLMLLVIPIAICAIRFGLVGGLAVSGLALFVTVSWYVFGDHSITWLGYVSRATVLLVVGGLVGHFADVRRRLEKTIERAQSLSLDLIAMADFDGNLIRVNPAWTQTLGFTEAELLASSFRTLIHPDDRERTTAESTRIAAGVDSVNFQNRLRAKDGSYHWLEWTARSDVEEGMIYTVARDVTQRKLAEEVLENHNHLLERLVRDRTRALEEARLETLRRLALAAEFRDDDTYAHTERVGRTAELLARELGLPEEMATLIRLAAPLHDVGKLGVNDSILLKPGKLSAGEFALMQEHVKIGAVILGGSISDVLQTAEEIARTHHERWDGGGYPLGLREESIPISGRIVAVADVFDALTHTRPYKEAWPLEKAIAEIQRLSGSHFDPAVVSAFKQLDHIALLNTTPEPSHLAA
jgi:PAS domain S-box-containing protein/putative nucleotidyltransferase with HDIG domain